MIATCRFNLMQGKSMVFAGNSLRRNQMYSLICLLSRVSFQLSILDSVFPYVLHVFIRYLSI